MKLTSRTQLANAYARVRKMLALCGKYADPRSATFDYQDESNDAWYFDYIKDCARLTLKQFINEGTEFRFGFHQEAWTKLPLVKVELDGINVSIIMAALLGPDGTTYVHAARAFEFRGYYQPDDEFVKADDIEKAEMVLVQTLNRALYGTNPKNWLIG